MENRIRWNPNESRLPIKTIKEALRAASAKYEKTKRPMKKAVLMTSVPLFFI